MLEISSVLLPLSLLSEYTAPSLRTLPHRFLFHTTHYKDVILRRLVLVPTLGSPFFTGVSYVSSLLPLLYSVDIASIS